MPSVDEDEKKPKRLSAYGRMVEDRSSPIPIHIHINKIVSLFFSSTSRIGSFDAARLLRIC